MKKIIYSNYLKVIAVILFLVCIALGTYVLTDGYVTLLDEEIIVFELENSFDKIIVGSDQVWNPVVTGGDTNYYLAFSQNFDQKASYAPSFGIDKVEEKDQKIVAELLNNIKYLCAREERGQDNKSSCTNLRYQ